MESRANRATYLLPEPDATRKFLSELNGEGEIPSSLIKRRKTRFEDVMQIQHLLRCALGKKEIDQFDPSIKGLTFEQARSAVSICIELFQRGSGTATYEDLILALTKQATQRKVVDNPSQKVKQ